ncbi:enoyl-CoA hydratase/isomerase family protein [Sulfitobacter porphyrae]|uniref:Enoyl-CoA hydratase/isomerase family protein n=1 Tax=Sulfitobacter porphyrae TaxID=1246864 RepID=A0ABW2B7Q5_9RHOB
MPPLTLHIADGRAVLTLANPEQGNRLNAPFMERMTGAVAELERRDDYRCLILRAQGPQFCVGGAIDEFIAADDFADHIRHTLPPHMMCSPGLPPCPCPSWPRSRGRLRVAGWGWPCAPIS